MIPSGTIHSADDARRLARRRLPWMIFDYIDGTAGDGAGMHRNRAALDAAVLEPRILRDVSRRTMSVDLFGTTAKRPFGIAPMGMCNLAAPDADMMLAHLAARDSVPLCISTMSTTPMETLLSAAQGNAWFQLYFSGDGAGSFKLAQRAQDAGFGTLILTADVPEVGRRPRELAHGFTMPFRIGPRQFIDFACHPRWSVATLLGGKPRFANFDKDGFKFDRTESRAAATWDHLAKLRDLWRGRLVVKGVMNVGDAKQLASLGVDAIQVSSHGARQLQSAPAPFDRLRDIRAALGPAVPLFFDSGLRSGEDVLKTLIQGANFTFLGRILLFAIAAKGEEGLHQLWDVLTQELSIAMAQTGRARLP